MRDQDIDLLVVVSAPFEENTYILRRRRRTDCVIVDPGLEPEAIIEGVERQGWTPAAILTTHAHGDHIGGNEAVKARWPDCPIIIGEHEADKLTDPTLNLSAAFGAPITSPPADRLVADGESFEVAGMTFETRHIPGHSTGHVVFVLRDHEPVIVLGGDVLFAGSVGRTDFPNGSMRDLVDGIRTKLFNLSDTAVVLPGHGPQTTIGQEKATNPYVRA